MAVALGGDFCTKPGKLCLRFRPWAQPEAPHLLGPCSETRICGRIPYLEPAVLGFGNSVSVGDTLSLQASSRRAKSMHSAGCLGPHPYSRT